MPKQKTIKNLIKKSNLILMAVFMAVFQLLVLVEPAKAVGQPLTLIHENGEVPLAEFPTNIANMEVNIGGLAVVTTDGEVYTNAGKLEGVSNAAKAFVAEPGVDVGFVIKTDGTLWSWGDGARLGRLHDIDNDGVNDSDSSLGQVTGVPTIKDIKIQYGNVLALTEDGHVWAWGDNDSSQLGAGLGCQEENCFSVLPVQIPNLAGVDKIAINGGGGSALLTGGQLMEWGVTCNVETFWPEKETPVVTDMISGTVKDIASSDCTNVAVMEDGSAYMWGQAGVPLAPAHQVFGPESQIVEVKGDGAGNWIYRSQNNQLYRQGGNVYYNDQELAEYKQTPYPIGSVNADVTFVSSFGSAVIDGYIPSNPGERIYFKSNSKIHGMNVDGRVLEEGMDQDFVLSIAWNGKMTFISESDIIMSNIDGTNQVNITNTPEYDEWMPVLSQDGSKVVFNRWDPFTDRVNLYAMNVDGSDLRMVLPGYATASWSPDGSKIAFHRIYEQYEEGQEEPQYHEYIGTINADGTGYTVFEGQLDVVDNPPAWSPDGSKITWTDYAPGDQNRLTLRVANADGTDVQILYNTSNNIFSHAWSPDSSKIIFAELDLDGVGTAIKSISPTGGAIDTMRIEPDSYIDYLHWLPARQTTDQTAPIAGDFAWEANPKAISATTGLTVSVSDDDSGLAAAEYYLGDEDPGQGNGASMELTDMQEGGLYAYATTTFGTDFDTGVYKVNVRAVDNAGNWGEVSSDYLVVYNPDGPRITGKKVVVPSLGNGDVLPGLIDSSQDDKAKFGFSVKYNDQGQISNNSDFQLTYSTGSHCKNPSRAVNCHNLEINSTYINWLVVNGENNSTGVFQGLANLNIDGQSQSVKFRITGRDGTRLTPESTEQFQMMIYAENANPDTDQPIHRINATDIERGNIKII